MALFEAPNDNRVVAVQPDNALDAGRTEQQLFSAQPTENLPRSAFERPSPIALDTEQTLDAPAVADNSPAEEIVETVPTKYATSVYGWLALGLAALWLIVALALSARLARAWRHLATLRRRATKAEASTIQTCQELASTLKVVTPEVLRSPCLPSPCLAGLRRPVILLPEDDQCLSIREVLLHELAHMKRRDCHWNLLRQVATAVFYFQPLLWKLSRLLETTAEEVCDDYVVEFGGNRQEYAHRLVDIAELSSAPIAAAGVGIVSLRSMLARRVTRIMDTSRTLSTRVGNLLLALVVVGGLVGTTVTAFVGLAPLSSQAEPRTPVDITNSNLSESPTKKENIDVGPNSTKNVSDPLPQELSKIVRVVNSDGNPIVGATVTPWAMRTAQGHGSGLPKDMEQANPPVR